MTRLIPFLLLMVGIPLMGQSDYPSPSQLVNSIKQLQQANASKMKVEELATTEGGMPIHVITLSNDMSNAEQNPALAIVAGVEGAHLFGSSLALEVASAMLQDDEASKLLDEVTVYIIPQGAPDAAQAYFQSPKQQRSGNAKSTDDDRDGRFDEDPAEDLNGDGMITMMRIKDETGSYKLHPADDRVLIKANMDKAEKGMYRLLIEGRDNDKDGAFNEDGQGGINFNQNLTFNFKHFAAGAGEFPVSEVETRAVVDYLFDRWNVFAVLTYGPSDNLAAPLKYSRNNQKGNIITGILQGDAKINAVVAGDFKKTMKLPKSAKQNLTAGGFMEWAHFHYGRYSFGTPGWYVPDWKMPKDSVERLAFKEVKDGNADINFLRWAADQGMQNFFVNWTKVDHPDFPDHEVEVGGIAPYVMLNPPYNMVKNQVEPHLNFVKKLLGYRPQVKLVNTKVEKVSNDLWRVKASVMNDGFFATASDMGNRFNFVKRVKATMELNDGQQFLSGQKVQLFGAMKGGTSNELEWLINGNGTVTLTVGAPQCGVERMELELK